MESLTGLRSAETVLLQLAGRIPAIGAKLDDLTMRAHRIAASKRSGDSAHRDPSFVHDIQVFRRELNTLAQELDLLPDVLARIHRIGDYQKEADDLALAVQRLCDRLA